MRSGAPDGNLFLASEAPAEGERFEPLLIHRNLVVERIVSSATITPQEAVQEQDEWVVLLRGKAVVEVGDEAVTLTEGDHLFLPAGAPHTVRSVSAGALWLAVHLHPGESAPPDR